MGLILVEGDLTKLKVEAIVNPANPRPAIGGGLDGQIHRAAGGELLKARQEIGSLNTTEVAITPGFNLPAKYIIHAVGPIWAEEKVSYPLLVQTYANALQLAVAKGIKSMAFPLLSAGIFGCPMALSFKAATEVLEEYLAQEDMDLYIVAFGHGLRNILRDDNEELAAYLGECFPEEDGFHGLDFCKIKAEIPDIRDEIIEAPIIQADLSLAEFLNQGEASFSQCLMELIGQQNKSEVEIYKRANMDRRLFSKIRNKVDYQPKKYTALALAVALELDLENTGKLLASAGYTLTHSNKGDIIVEYYIAKGIYDIFTINEALFAYDQRLLGA